jgi:NAD(P)-dependent dehydrogenase (short-subunit alcohol dehydrogenase family)
MKLKPVGEQVVVVMGASSSIGRETALRLAKRGAKMVVAAGSEAGLRSLEDEIRELGGEARAVVADVCEFEQVEAVAQSAVEEYGRLDTWVHLAAAGLFASFDQTQPKEFKRVVDVDLMGQVYGAMAALPRIKREGRGALVHISSVVGKLGAFTERLQRLKARHRRLPGVAACRTPARGIEQHRRHQCHAGGHQHAALRQGPHQTGRQAQRVPRSTSRALWPMRFSTALRRRPGR